MFQASVIRYPVKLKVHEVGRNVAEVVEARARKMLEATCSYVGFTKPGSLRLLHLGAGVLSGIDMGRHFTFQCTFGAEVCNPPPGTRMKTYVRSINRFGALMEAGYLDPMGTLVPVVELVVIRDPTIARNEVDVAGLAVGDEVGVEVLGRRFELRDTRITGFARTVKDVDGAEVGAGGADLAERSGLVGDAGEDDDPSADDGEGSDDDDGGAGSDDEGGLDGLGGAGKADPGGGPVGATADGDDDDLASWADDEEGVLDEESDGETDDGGADEGPDGGDPDERGA